MRRAGLAASVLAACALAGVFAALAFGGAARPADTTAPTPTTPATDTAPTTTAPTDTTPTDTTPTTTAPVPAALADGVTIGGVRVGSLALADAAAAVEQRFASPLVLRYGKTTITVSPDLLGATAGIDRALARAQVAAPGAVVPLNVTVNRRQISAFLARLAKRFDRKPVDARLVLRNLKPVVTRSSVGHTLDVKRAAAAMIDRLKTNRRAGIRLRAKAIAPTVSAKSFSSVIVIRRGSNLLLLYSGSRPVRTFHVATGQSIYPTPLGSFHIVVMWKNPWWYPPSSPWAAGEKPVPPGPGNPLGTRWMGIDSPGVGIHGTPESGSIGYSLSHGCIRMLIPQAEWLFQHVHVGTPVFIVSA